MNLHRLCQSMLIFFLATLLAAPSNARAQERADVPWQNHDWGRFPVGSWQRIRVVTEHLSPSGEVLNVSTTEKLTRVIRCTRRAVTLRSTSMMEVAGKRFETPEHDIHQGDLGEPISPTVSAKDLGETELTVEGRKIPCRVRQYEFTDAEETRVVKIYYSDKVAPFILKREEVAKAGENTRNESMVSVTAFDKPHKVLANIVPASYVREVHKKGKSTTTTLAVYAQDVPGGMVAYTSQETDTDGILVRRSTAELVDYGFSRSGGGDDFRFRRGFARDIIDSALGLEPREDTGKRYEVSRARLPVE